MALPDDKIEVDLLNRRHMSIVSQASNTSNVSNVSMVSELNDEEGGHRSDARGKRRDMWHGRGRGKPGDRPDRHTHHPREKPTRGDSTMTLIEEAPLPPRDESNGSVGKFRGVTRKVSNLLALDKDKKGGKRERPQRVGPRTDGGYGNEAPVRGIPRVGRRDADNSEAAERGDKMISAIKSQDVTQVIGHHAESAFHASAFDMAEKISANPEQLKKEGLLPGRKGRFFSESVFGLYLAKGHLTDGMWVSCQKPKLLPGCCLPMCWPVRLGTTLRRAEPVDYRPPCCCGFAWRLRGNRIPLVITLVFVPPMLTAIFWAPPIQVPLQKALGSELYFMIAFLVVLALSSLLCAWFWAAILLGVARKYKIDSVRDKPCMWVVKTMACICPMNVRVGVHVDRSLGFEKPLREEGALIELAENMRKKNQMVGPAGMYNIGAFGGAARKPPGQEAMV